MRRRRVVRNLVQLPYFSPSTTTQTFELAANMPVTWIDRELNVELAHVVFLERIQYVTDKDLEDLEKAREAERENPVNEDVFAFNLDLSMCDASDDRDQFFEAVEAEWKRLRPQRRLLGPPVLATCGC